MNQVGGDYWLPGGAAVLGDVWGPSWERRTEVSPVFQSQSLILLSSVARSSQSQRHQMLRLHSLLIILAVLSHIRPLYIIPVAFKQSSLVPHIKRINYEIKIKVKQSRGVMLVLNLTMLIAGWLPHWPRSWLMWKISGDLGTTPGARSKDGVSYNSHPASSRPTTEIADWVIIEFPQSQPRPI